MQQQLDIGLATVYRVLMQFEQADILKRSHFESDVRCMSSTKVSTTTTWCV
jgi:Fe2+ or Zn2+ uptake regulation protein